LCSTDDSDNAIALIKMPSKMASEKSKSEHVKEEDENSENSMRHEKNNSKVTVIVSSN